jgi:hypothetical protein
VQLDRPGGPGHRVVEPGPGPDLLGGQLVPTLDPAGLPTSGVAVGADPRRAERPGKLGLQQRERLVRLVSAFELGPGGFGGIQRRPDVGHIQHRGVSAGEEEGQPAAAQQPVSPGLSGQHGVDLARVRLAGLVDVFHDDLLGAVDGALGDPARQPGLPGQRGVAAGVDEAVGSDGDVPVAGREVDAGDAAVVEAGLLQDRAEHGLDAEVPDRRSSQRPSATSS